jgi:hypothetical protein
MKDEVKFLAYCVEIYKDAKKISGKQVFSLFEQCGVLDYVMDCYGALHTTGPQYTVNDIDEFIAAQGISSPRSPSRRKAWQKDPQASDR